MKTLIFNGSPRKKGETKKLIQELSQELGGEIKVVDAYTANIRPCVDCRWCFTREGCAVKDEMQEVFSYIQECDHIVIASPIYFEELTGMLLAILSRLQTYFSARYLRKEDPVPRKKQEPSFLLREALVQEKRQRVQLPCFWNRWDARVWEPCM